LVGSDFLESSFNLVQYNKYIGIMNVGEGADGKVSQSMTKTNFRKILLELSLLSNEIITELLVT
jgi:hypothetical protein